nr:anthranilate synthase component I family protein [Sediminivirga luteola]
MRAHLRTVDAPPDPAAVLEALFPDPNLRIWLDSAAADAHGPGTAAADAQGPAAEEAGIPGPGIQGPDAQGPDSRGPDAQVPDASKASKTGKVSSADESAKEASDAARPGGAPQPSGAPQAGGAPQADGAGEAAWSGGRYSYFCGPDSLTKHPPEPDLVVHHVAGDGSSDDLNAGGDHRDHGDTSDHSDHSDLSDLRDRDDLLGLLAARLAVDVAGADRIPGPFRGGYLGYFGYELGAEFGLATRQRSPHPDAVWLRSDRFAVLDHAAGTLTLVALAGPLGGLTPEAAESWLDAARRRLAATTASPPGSASAVSIPAPVSASAPAGSAASHAPGPGGMTPASSADEARSGQQPQPQHKHQNQPPHQLQPQPPHQLQPRPQPQHRRLADLTRPRADYEAAVRAAQRELVAGESYEICLTTTLTAPSPAPADRARELDEYLALRETNPAAYAAFLQLPDGLTVFSSSPERFLRVDAGGCAESRPIKGTAPRVADPAEDARLRDALRQDPKTTAENLMIVDLVRNDLGRVSRSGSVEVPDLMAVQTLPHVHQLYSTVRGLLRPGLNALDAVRACFPGGSMTGAPKERTCEIIDRLETGPRGIYSGALGWLGFDGAADLSIVIRTAVRQNGLLRIGSGGAIVLGSDPNAEYREMLLKAGSVAGALLGGQPGSQAPGT